MRACQFSMGAIVSLCMASLVISGELSLSQEVPPMQDELERLNETWNRAWLDKDADAVDELMTEGYVYVAPHGQVLDRQALLDIIRSPSFQIHGGSRTEVSIRSLTPDTAVVLHRWQGEGTYAGASFTDDHRCTMVCVKQGAEWRVALEHCSLNRA